MCALNVIVKLCANWQTGDVICQKNFVAAAVPILRIVLAPGINVILFNTVVTILCGWW